MRYIINGLGQQGRAVLDFLMLHSSVTVESVDPIVNTEPLEEVYSTRWVHHKANDWAEIADEGDVIIDCGPLKQPIAGAELPGLYINLGGDTSLTRRILAGTLPAKRVLLDCGLAPGLASSMAMGYLREGYRDVVILCGGLPAEPKGALGYARSFSAEGLIREYMGDCEAVRRGRFEVVPALGKVEAFALGSLGIFEAAHTSGGLSLTPERTFPEFDRLEYMTLRYGGHFSAVKKDILPLGDAAPWAIRSLTPVVGRDNPDIVILGAVVKGLGTEAWIWKYNFARNISAMAQATGYTAAAVALLLSTSEEYNRPVIHMDEIPLNDIVRLLDKEPEQMVRIDE